MTKPIFALIPPNKALITSYLWKQKRRGSLFLRAYPSVQAFALPLLKDKQRKPAHAKWYYKNNSTLHLIINNRGNEPLAYNTPTQTPRCITPVRRIKVAKFEHTDSNVRKRPFRDVPYKRRSSLFHRCLWPALSIKDWLSQRQSYLFFLTIQKKC